MITLWGGRIAFLSDHDAGVFHRFIAMAGDVTDDLFRYQSRSARQGVGFTCKGISVDDDFARGSLELFHTDFREPSSCPGPRKILFDRFDPADPAPVGKSGPFTSSSTRRWKSPGYDLAQMPSMISPRLWGSMLVPCRRDTGRH